jgi:RNA polymerase sigma factor (sigma-70 family)
MAEDVAQEAFARALVHWWRIKRGPNPPGYVYTAGFRLLSRAQRRIADDRTRDDGLTSAAGPSDPTATTATSSVAAHAALSAMPPRRRACAVMCLVVGLSVSEAGEALGIADGTVRKHLEEARRELAAVL